MIDELPSLDDIAPGFDAFYRPLHDRFAQRRRELVDMRAAALDRAHRGETPRYLEDERASSAWRVNLPEWCRDQRNQMTGPADDAELVVKMLNSGAPGVMLDLEDSMVNEFDHVLLGHANILAALRGELTYDDRKRGERVGIRPSETVIWSRVRGLHLAQRGVFEQETPASLFDVGLLAFRVDLEQIKNRTLCLYIPKSESAAEAQWWSDVFAAVIDARGWRADAIKCMALVEAFPMAYELEPFAYNLREYILGFNLGRWDYMASLLHFNLHDQQWMLPDRNTIPLDVPFFQNLRTMLPAICHKHGMLAIGGMTALYPSREDAELNARALDVLARDKKNEATCLMDGAWTGHPDQNEIALAQFPYPNQMDRIPDADLRADLRPAPKGIGNITIDGSLAAAVTVIRYRYGVLCGKGASLIDGYMEDLATDRIYRLMIAQRFRFPGKYVPKTQDELFDRALQSIFDRFPDLTAQERDLYGEARRIAQEMIESGRFDPT